MYTHHALACATLLAATLVAGAQRPDPKAREGSLKVGDPAPDFSIQDTEGKNTLALSARRGRPVVLCFGSCT